MINIYKSLVKKLRSRERPTQKPEATSPHTIIEWADLPPHHPRSGRE